MFLNTKYSNQWHPKILMIIKNNPTMPVKNVMNNLNMSVKINLNNPTMFKEYRQIYKIPIHWCPPLA